MRQGAGRPRARLDVYVARHCLGCEEARRLTEEAAAHFPRVDIRLVDVDEGRALPERVVAVPTYVMNGVVISLGNPSLQELLARLGEAAT